MLRIAKVIKSNGTDGGLLVGAPEVELQEISGPVFIEFDGLPVPFFIQDCQQRGTNKYIIHLNDIRNLEDAEEVVGRDIFADVEFEEEEEEDFVGWTVFDGAHKIGTVSDIAPIPGNLCLYVKPDGAEDEVLIPLHEDFIVSADPDKKELCLELPEGLY